MIDVQFYKDAKRVTTPELADRAYVWARGVCLMFPATPDGRADLERVLKLARVQFAAGYTAAQSDIRKALTVSVDK